MGKRKNAIDIILDEIEAAYEDDYFFDEDQFEELSQKNKKIICKYLINELKILGINYNEILGMNECEEEYDIDDIELLIYEVVYQWKTETIGMKGVSQKENETIPIDIFIKNNQIFPEGDGIEL